MAEQAFLDTLDAAEGYMALQQALAEALRAGFLSLAQARYSMGADRVSSLQYPTHMAATARLHATGSGDLELVIAQPAVSAGASPTSPASPSSSGSSWGAAREPAAHSAASGQQETGAGVSLPSTAGSSADAARTDVAGGAGEESLEEQLLRLRLAAQQNDSLLEQLAAKYGCNSSGPAANDASPGPSYTGDDQEYAVVAKPGKPLHWFGSLVAPSLRDAEAHFGRALALAVQAANAQRRLRQGLEGYDQGAGPLQQQL